MSPANSVFTFLLLLVVSTEGDLYGHAFGRCHFSSPDGLDAVYLEQFYFNKKLMGQYNSTVGKAVGYTKEATKVADWANSHPWYLSQQRAKTEHCRKIVPQTQIYLTSVEPYVWLREVKAEDNKHPSILACSVYDFYPKHIRVSWLRDGKETTSDVTSTEELPNGNWLYQIHSYLEFTPKPGEKISCRVEHVSLMEPKLYDWEQVPDWGMTKIAVGMVGLLLGLAFSVSGMIYHKKMSAVRVALPMTEVSYPEETL